jgi:hypothetical protein
MLLIANSIVAWVRTSKKNSAIAAQQAISTGFKMILADP